MSRSAGFSLVELLVALVIFSFGVLAGVALLGTGHRWEGQAELEAELTVAAEMKLEELKAIAGTDLPDTVQLVVGGSLSADVAGYWDTVQLGARVFKRRWLVGPGPAAMRQTTVRAIPFDPPSSGEAELTTYLIHE